MRLPPASAKASGTLSPTFTFGPRSNSITCLPPGAKVSVRADPDLVAAGRVASILVERIDGTPALQPEAGGPSPVAAALSEAGFTRTPRGMRLR